MRDAQVAIVSLNIWLWVGKEKLGETCEHEINYIRSALKELRKDLIFKL